MECLGFTVYGLRCERQKGRGVYFTSKPFQLQLCISLRNYHKFQKTHLLWTNALPSLQPPSSYIGVFPCVNAPYWASFWFSSVVDWVHKHVCTTLLSLRFQATTKVFVAHTGNTSLSRVVPRYTDTASASVPLGLVSTEAPLISSSTHSAKLPFFQKVVTVIVIVEFACVFKTTMNGGRWHMYETN